MTVADLLNDPQVQVALAHVRHARTQARRAQFLLTRLADAPGLTSAPWAARHIAALDDAFGEALEEEFGEERAARLQRLLRGRSPLSMLPDSEDVRRALRAVQAPPTALLPEIPGADGRIA